MGKNIDTNKSKVQHVQNFVTNLVIYIKIKKIIPLLFFVFLVIDTMDASASAIAAAAALSFNSILINFH